MQKLVAFFIPNNELLERETKKTIPFIIVSKNKIPGNNFNHVSKKPVLSKLEDTGSGWCGSVD